MKWDTPRVSSILYRTFAISIPNILGRISVYVYRHITIIISRRYLLSQPLLFKNDLEDEDGDVDEDSLTVYFNSYIKTIAAILNRLTGYSLFSVGNIYTRLLGEMSGGNVSIR